MHSKFALLSQWFLISKLTLASSNILVLDEVSYGIPASNILLYHDGNFLFESNLM
jgi:hypothetical protein